MLLNSVQYYRPVEDIASSCAAGEAFTADHSMICKLGGLTLKWATDLEAEFLSMVCSDVANKAHDAMLDIHARTFWERHRSAFFDMRICHPDAVSYRDL